jgi:hypothetical protein
VITSTARLRPKFLPGETVTTIERFPHDNELEFEERGSRCYWSNPVGATLAVVPVTGTINDDDEPTRVARPRRQGNNAVFVWQDCSTSEWFLRCSGRCSRTLMAPTADAVRKRRHSV